MHCMDSSYSEFSILPPYNTIEAQLIVGGKLVTNAAGYTLTYEAIADPEGSINTSSIGKGNWIDFAPIVYGIPLHFTADMGLAGWNMPGPLNTPQPMLFENVNTPAPGVSTPVNWFRAEGIPITPYDDAGNKNTYPMMRIVARNSANQVIATGDIVLPVSDEMDCAACHAANGQPEAMPAGGWVTDADPIREYRLNILKIHDDHQFADNPALYADARAAQGFSQAGLYDTTMSGKPMLCAACHASEALGTPSFSSAHGTVPSLTASVHSRHADVHDPQSRMTLDNSANRSACYLCHPGSTTRCLRGAMGSAVAPDGSMAMQCQSCHGTMSHVGASTRVGWFMEPKCQSCHSGDAVNNSGQIRYSSVFDSAGNERVPADNTFGTNPDVPAAGISLYRFSVGHGGLQCSACHGSTHAEFPASHPNDNLNSTKLQGHAGVIIECMTCHTTMPTKPKGGPHGLHPIGQAWIEDHHDAIEATGLAACQKCHGVDYRGTVLSKAHAHRSFDLEDEGTVTFYRGATIGCYTCHRGPYDDDMNTNPPPAIANVSAQTMAGVPVDIILPGSVAGVNTGIISQPQNGSIGFTNGVATYFPFEGFTGLDAFTFAGYDGAKNSALATGTVRVVAHDPSQQAPSITLDPVSQTIGLGANVTLNVIATGTYPMMYQWFKDSWPIPGATNATLTINAVAGVHAGTYRALVINAASSTASAAAKLTVVVQPPGITGFSPASGSVGMAVDIAGSNFTGATAVKFNGRSAAFSLVSGTLIRATVPAGAVSGSISVTTPAGTATSASKFTIVLVPTLNSFSPASGPVGTRVTINGSGYGGATTVRFNGTASTTVNLLSAAQLTAKVPAGATTGPITISTAGGTATSATPYLVTVSPPRITGFAPTSGAAGTAVTITGTNFSGTTSVEFNGASAPFTVLSTKKIVCGVPTGATTGRISVTTTNGLATSGKNFGVGSKPVAPKVGSFSPTSGSAGTVVTVSGSNLGGVTSVKLGATSASSFAITSANALKFTVPAGAVTGPISVTTDGGTTTSSGSFTVTP